MRHSFRLRRAARMLPVLGASVALAAVPSIASAQTTQRGAASGADAQNTNVPYLAWAGEQVRLEKCWPTYGITAEDFSGLGDGIPRASFNIDDPGDASASAVDPTVKMFYSRDALDGDGGICAEGDFLSSTPGLARIELDVTDDAGILGLPDYGGPAQPFLAHQFLAGWMTYDTPVLKEMAAGDFAGSANAADELGDPSGNGQFTAGGKGGYLDVKVTGNLPLSSAQQNLSGGASSYTLPDDWDAFAHAFATDFTYGDSTPWFDWDTSGDSHDTSGHNPLAGCVDNDLGAPAETATDPYVFDAAGNPILDNVDNCTGGDADGPFSTDRGTLSSDDAVGPFDPTNEAATSLPDGNLDAQDAPMPAARVDFKIAQNSGSSTDTSGIGSLEPANKVKTDSRDFEGDLHPTQAGDLYAPFYDTFIPATARPTTASSGIDGAYGNNFPGFLTQQFLGSRGGNYHYWDTFMQRQNGGASDGCLNYSRDDDPQAGSRDDANVFRSGPSGDYWDAVYTDQNGEAQIRYNPGTGAYYDNLGADKNADGGCDLQGITTLGTSSITATALYPYKPVNYLPATSNTVTETVNSLFDKAISYAPKGSSAEDQSSRIVIVHAQDVDGTAYGDEAVCFSADANAERITRFGGFVNGVYYGGSSIDDDPDLAGLGGLCLDTDANGNAAIEVIDSDRNAVDVTADFADEGLLRSTSVNFAVDDSSSGSVPTSPVTQPGMSGGSSPTQPVPAAGSAGTTQPTAAVIAQTDPRLATQVTKSKARTARLSVVRLVRSNRGDESILIRVRSTQSHARVFLSMRVRQGRRMRTVHRTITVRANRLVSVKVSRSVARIAGARLG